MPASRNARATTLTPRSWPSRPTLASITRMGVLIVSPYSNFLLFPLLYTVYDNEQGRGNPSTMVRECALESLVSPTTLVDQAYAVILDAICDGTLKPGERLTQADVAERLNVSRQPVHNALLVLKSQGFLQESGRRGLCVAPLDPAL